jgi:RsiW-degrading membrane proteinase PrsW (M82 family)
MDERDSSGDVGLLPVIAFGTLFVFYMIWAAMHDIAHGESDTTAEWTVLIVSVPTFAVLYYIALSLLGPNAKFLWLAGTGLLVLLFNLGAVNAILYPKYAPDPMLASLFLAAGVPVLALIGYHLTREARRRLHRPRF